MSNAFATAAISESRRKYTENGAKAYSSTGNPLLDLFSSIGAMRAAAENTIETLLSEAYDANPLLTTKAMFYTRDIRGERVGKGERATFRIMLKWMATHHPEAVKPNIPLIGVYGRYDDLYTLIGTPCEDDMWNYMKELIDTDYSNMCWNKCHTDNVKKKPVSLLCKWMKSIHTSSKESRAIAKLTYKKLGFKTEKMYRQILGEMRAYIPVLERQMSDGKWDEIDYESIPALAMKTYRAAFERHDVQGKFTEYKTAVKEGTAKINASTLFPYDLVSNYIDNSGRGHEDDIIEAQWKAMPDYIGKAINALVICDTSGSMFRTVGRIRNLPIKAAIGLAIYFAEHNHGPFHNLFMTFSGTSKYVKLQGSTLLQKVSNAMDADWGMDTNLEGAFERVLRTAVDNKLSNDDLPKALIVVSDMQINACVTHNWSFYHAMKARFAEYGYEIPKVIFWNVNCITPTMLVDDKNRDGVQLISGLNAKTFAEIIDNTKATADELMMNCLNNPRYDAVTIA